MNTLTISRPRRLRFDAGILLTNDRCSWSGPGPGSPRFRPLSAASFTLDRGTKEIELEPSVGWNRAIAGAAEEELAQSTQSTQRRKRTQECLADVPAKSRRLP